MKVSVIGAGALGKTYGGLLSLANHEVHYLVRSDYAQIKRAGYFELDVREFAKTLQIKNPLLYTNSQDLPLSDLVIISLKTTENQQLPALLRSCLKKDSIVLVIQNGIGNEEMISRFTSGHPLICGIASIGASRKSANAVDISFIGNIKLAAYQLKDKIYCDTIVEAFKNIPIELPITYYDNYKEIRWSKLAWNVPFSSLSLIFDKPTNVLASQEPYLSMVSQLIDEVRAVAKADGVILTDEYIDDMQKVTQKSKNYFPSMVKDFQAGKPIEKEYIFDNVIAIAEKYKIKIPFLTLIEKQLSLMLKLRDLQ